VFGCSQTPSYGPKRGPTWPLKKGRRDCRGPVWPVSKPTAGSSPPERGRNPPAVLAACGCGRAERDELLAVVAVAPVAPSVGPLLSLSPAAGASAIGTPARRNDATAHTDRRALTPLGMLAPADTPDRPTLCACAPTRVGSGCVCNAKRLCMAHLTVEISAVANRLCPVRPVAENGNMGNELGRARTVPCTRITTTVVLTAARRPSCRRGIARL
jgi:hypothetical protein